MTLSWFDCTTHQLPLESPRIFLDPQKWTELRYLLLQSEICAGNIQGTANLLQSFHPPKLAEVAVHFTNVNGSLTELPNYLPTLSYSFEMLEEALLKFSRQQEVCLSFESQPRPRIRLWVRALRQNLPLLHDRDALTVRIDTCEYKPKAVSTQSQIRTYCPTQQCLAVTMTGYNVSSSLPIAHGSQQGP